MTENSVSQKVAPAKKTFCNIFTQAQYISVKFTNLYNTHIPTNFGRFILIFNKMALIFLGVPIVLKVSNFNFLKSYRRDFIGNNEWSPVHPTSIHWINLGLGKC